MKNIFKFGFIVMLVFGFGNSIFADSANITQINFTSSPQSIDINTTSIILSVQTQNATGTAEQISETNHLDLTSTSATGEFFDANSTVCTDILTAPITLTMRSNSANKNFCYKDSTPGTYTITVTAQGQTWTSATQNITIVNTTPTPTAKFIIRNGDLEIYKNTVPLSGDRSVLTTLKSIDESSDAFSISNIQDFSFGKYLKCVLPTSGTELCDNWQYSVGSVTPFTSIDTTILSGGETVGIYFGNSHQLIFSENNITNSESLTATAQKYNYEDNVWNPLSGINIGVTLPNPDDPWNPTVVSTHPVDALGVANITITDVNTYTLGIAEDFYFPSYTITVSPTPNTGGSSGGRYTPPTFNTANALSYLRNAQSSDGSFNDSLLYTDWAAIAFMSLDANDSSKDKILSYFNSHNTLSSLLTDNERHAMALLALGQNPYSFNGVNYIDAIVNSFDGAQFGDVNLINDDIFALIPLKNSGYTADDDIIAKDISFLISKQKTDGSWEESIDITASAIQALKPFESIVGVPESITKASNYLKNKQNNDGGFGDSLSSIYSTSWAIQAMNALGASWVKGMYTPMDYLAMQQTTDGAVIPSSETLTNRIWATSYAITASSLKPWNVIMQNVAKPIQNNSGASLLNEKTNLIVENISAVDKKIENKSAPKSKSNSAPKIETATVDGVTADTITATAVNAIPNKTIPKAVPVAFGVLSGVVILYFVGKFIIK